MRVLTGKILAVVLLLVAHPASSAGSMQDVVEPDLRRVVGLNEAIDDVSISPDGRWVAFDVVEEGSGTSIWIVPAAGGKAVRLTDGSYTDRYPRWFPNSTRIAFTSNRNGSSEFVFHPWAVTFDPESGEATELLQIGIDEVASPGVALEVSPDGKSLAYAVWDDAYEIRVAPVVGGRPTTLARHADFVAQLRWTPAGDSVVYMQLTQERRRRVTVVPVEGGDPHVLLDSHSVIRISSDGRSMVQFVRRNSDGSAVWHHVALDGSELGSFRVADRLRLGRFRADVVTAIRRDIGAPVRIRSMLGGSARSLTENVRYHWVLDWSEDGTTVLVEAFLGDERFIVEMSPETGAYEVLRPAPLAGPTRYSADEGSLLLLQADGASDRFWNFVRWSRDGSEVELVDSVPRLHNYLGAVVGRGGTEFRDGPYDLSLASKAETFLVFAHDLRGSTPRILATFPKDEFPGVAVSDSLVAHPVTVDGETRVRIVGSEPRGGSVDLPLPEGTVGASMAWSRKGDVLAIMTYSESGVDMVFAARRGQAFRLGTPRPFPAKATLAMRWRSDDTGVVLVALGVDSNDDTSLMFVPVDPNDPIIDLTADETGRIYSFALSPTGNNVVYATEIALGSSVWLIDVPSR